MHEYSCKCVSVLSQVADRVHHEVVAGGMSIHTVLSSSLLQRQIGKKVHEPLEDTDPFPAFLRSRLAYQRNILVVQASLVICVTHLVAAGDIAERESEIAPLAQFVMHFTGRTSDQCPHRSAATGGKKTVRGGAAEP